MGDVRELPQIGNLLPPLVLGGAGFSYQIQPDPETLPACEIIKQAFNHGVRAIDTSPYYEPSEQILGRALRRPAITDHYSRSDYILMTKVGRIRAEEFNYSPEWVRKSVNRSLERLGTSYLDVVFCHDIEAVTDNDVLDAMGELIDFVRQGKVRYVGLSSYRTDILARRAKMVRERYGRSVDIIQCWAQLTLQNSLLETEGLRALQEAGVNCVCSSSPLAIGLLRSGGVPQGKLGDFHPAPAGLRKAAQDVADYVATQGDNLAALALRYSMWRAHEASSSSMRVCTITGISTIPELSENVNAAKKLLVGDFARHPTLNNRQVEKDLPLFEEAHRILGDWMDWSFVVPPKGWSQELKRMIPEESLVSGKL